MKKILLIIAASLMIFACGGDKNKDASQSPEAKSGVETKTAGFVEELKKQYAGKTLIVNFFASWCPPCRGETPDFVAAYEKYKGENFVIVGISVDKSVAEAEGFVKEFNVTYPVYHADNALGIEMNIGTIPTSFIYKPDGKLFDMVVGPLTAKELDIIAASFK